MTAAPAAGASVGVVRRRVVIGLGLAAVGFPAMLWFPAYAALCTVIAIACLWEFAQLSARGGAKLAFPVALAAVLAYFLLTSLGMIRQWEGPLLATTVIAALLPALFSRGGGTFARSGYTLLGVFYIGKLLSYWIALRLLPQIGLAVTVYAVLLIAMTDISAMLVGTSIGKTPLSPLSPRKTVEGALGGLAVAVIVGIAATLTPFIALHWWQGAFVGVVTSVAAQAGDLVESALKRDASVKDAGRLMGEHGGVLDRFDSFIFGGIAFYFALFVTGLIRH